MGVYVDALACYGWKHGRSCHLIADSDEELHGLAKLIGLKRDWFQPLSSPHYDLTEARRMKAVDNGAVELGRRAFIGKVRQRRMNGG